MVFVGLVNTEHIFEFVELAEEERVSYVKARGPGAAASLYEAFRSLQAELHGALGEHERGEDRSEDTLDDYALCVIERGVDACRSVLLHEGDWAFDLDEDSHEVLEQFLEASWDLYGDEVFDDVG